MKRRLQFSLLSAFIAMILIAGGVGLYIRWWPMYVTARFLDNAQADKSFPEWQKVRDSLIEDPTFRSSVFAKRDPTIIHSFHTNISDTCYFYLIVSGDSHAWMVRLHEDGNDHWSLVSIQKAPHLL
jgi:hypothetical protein